MVPPLPALSYSGKNMKLETDGCNVQIGRFLFQKHHNIQQDCDVCAFW